MPLTTQRAHLSIQPGDVDGVDLGPLAIITGPNGAGKSHLLEALSAGALQFDQIGQLSIPDQVRIFRLGELAAAAETPTIAGSYREPWTELYNSFFGWMAQRSAHATRESFISWLYSVADGSKLISRNALSRMAQELGKEIDEFTADDFKNYGPLIARVRDPFATSITEVFLSYASRRRDNDFQRWLMETEGRGSGLSDMEFQNRFGAPPWTLLDDALATVGLPYKFVPPPQGSDAVTYSATLNAPEGHQVTPSELSSGERALLAVALSLFTGTSMRESIQVPRLLLLDEPDASLHPSMIRSLLSILEDVFVKQYGVQVVMTTHSPTTVALAPEDALWIMSRTPPRLQNATRDAAVSALTVGIPTLSVRLDNQRQVFVESEYDQAVYQAFAVALRGYLPAERSFEFIAAGKRGIGGGCDAVKRLVSDLRGAGNATVLGVIDRDNRAGAPNHIFYVDDRHSIENLVFDPLPLGIFLLREMILSATELGLPEDTRHFGLDDEHARTLAETVSQRMSLTGDPTPGRYVGGLEMDIPRRYFEAQGHELEDVALKAFPALNGFKRDLKGAIVRRAIGDVPKYAPRSVLALFERLADT